jgi:DNA-directed RNA polymerase subunit K/omega
LFVEEIRMVQRPSWLNVFEFAVLSGLRATQLSRGCTPRVIASSKVAVTAQMEVAGGKVLRSEVLAATVRVLVPETILVPMGS